MPPQLGNPNSAAANGILFPFDLIAIATEGLMLGGQPPPVDETEGCPPQLIISTVDYTAPLSQLGSLDYTGADLLLTELAGYYPQLQITEQYEPQLTLLDIGQPPLLESLVIAQLGQNPPQLSVLFTQLSVLFTQLFSISERDAPAINVTVPENNPALIEDSPEANPLMQDDSDDVIPGLVVSGPVCSIE